MPVSVVRNRRICMDADVSMRCHVSKTVAACFADPQGFLIPIFPVNSTLIKRETVLQLKTQYVTVGLVGQTMLFANIS